MAGEIAGALEMDPGNYKRGTLEPIWGRLQEHEHDIRELYRASTQAHERVSATNETIIHLREDMRDWKEQTHRDSTSILTELKAANVRAATVDAKMAAEQGKSSGRWEMLKVVVPVGLGMASLILGGLTLLYKFGVLG